MAGARVCQSLEAPAQFLRSNSTEDVVSNPYPPMNPDPNADRPDAQQQVDPYQKQPGVPPPPQPFPQQSYAQQPPPYPYQPQIVVQRTSGFAVGGLVLSCLWLCGLGSLIGIAMSAIGYRDARRGAALGEGIAIAGLVVGIVGLLGTITFWLLVGSAAFTLNDTPDLSTP